MGAVIADATARAKLSFRGQNFVRRFRKLLN
jgi:hypothetical protein